MRWMTNDQLILNSKPLKPDAIRSALSQAGVSLLPAGRAILSSRGAKERGVELYAVQIITKAVGRLRHLSRYLVGRTREGTLYEVFLGTIEGASGTLFKAKETIKRGLVRFLSRGMSKMQLQKELLG